MERECLNCGKKIEIEDEDLKEDGFICAECMSMSVEV